MSGSTINRCPFTIDRKKKRLKIMPDNKLSAPRSEILNQRMNQLAREISAMDPDDPRRVELIDEISALSLISAEMKAKG